VRTVETYPTPAVESDELLKSSQVIDLTSHLPEDDTLNKTLAAAGVTADAVLDIEAGRQRFAVVDISKAPSSRVRGGRAYRPFAPYVALGRNSPEVMELEETSPYMLLHLADNGTLTARALRKGEPIVLGRGTHAKDPKSARFEYAHSDYLSREHLTLFLGRDGRTLQIDDSSTNGTKLRYSTDTAAEKAVHQTTPPIYDHLREARPPKLEPNYRHAASMQPDELWAEKNNSGRYQDPSYVRNYQRVRTHIVETFKQGDLYKDSQAFTQFLKSTHHFLARTGDYGRLNFRDVPTDDYGEFREGGKRNARMGQARWTAELGEYYGDPYAQRFERGIPGSESFSEVSLPGIEERDLPYDVVRYDKDGNPKDVEDGGYEYVYPPASSIPEYIDQITSLGQQIEGAIKQGGVNPDAVLSLIARQYQYGAIVRPFNQINNSIFMQFANAQVKLLGYNGVTHGAMDIAAQRLQPDTFARYFIDRVKGVAE
jgi:hypothetical protein